jgi:hypothetical protein
MADKTPVRVVFNASNVATGMAEFQTGESVPVVNGGTGLIAVGGAGQVLKVNAAGTGLEFGAEGDLSITNLVAPTNADLTFSTSGTGNIILDAITVRGTTISSADSSIININEGVVIDGTLNTSGQATLSGLAYPTSDGTVGQFLKTDGSGTLAFADLSLGDLTIIGSTISVPSNADFTLDPSGTGAIKLNANTDITGNLTVTGTLDLGDSNFTNVGSLQLDSIAGDGDTNTSITFSGTDVITVATGGSTAATFNADQSATFNSSVTVGGSNAITISDNSITTASSNADITLTPHGTGDINLTAGADVNIPANIGLTFGDDGEKIEGDGTNLTISSSGNLNLKSTSNIITFEGGGTGFLQLQNDSGSTWIRNTGQDKDIKFLGNDGGGTITALTLDISEAGAATFNGTVTATSFVTTGNAVTIADNNITTGTSNADINITPHGTGGVVITSGGVAFTMPTSDGDDGDFMKTDGSGALSFASATATPSDDTRVTVKSNKSVSTSARTIDYFQATGADMAWYFMALNDLTNDHVGAAVFAICHNDSDAFAGGPRGGSSGTANTMPATTADVSSGQVRVKVTAPSADSKISYYKIPLSRANTADETAGVTITTSNTDVDSASESIDTFVHATYRAAKYTILIDDNAKTETGVTEALVVHDGTNAFVVQYGTINTGNNDMITLSAAISGSNVVVSAAGLTPNLSLKTHKTLLADSMTAVSNANQKIIGATTVSSTATAFDNFDVDDANAALYYVVGKNATEGTYSVQEVYMTGAPGEAGVSQGPFVSSKETTQLEFTADWLTTTDNSVGLNISSTSGGSTTVNAYRINCLAE